MSTNASQWTLRRTLAWIAQDFAALGIATSRLDAEVLVAFALGLTRVKLYLDLDRPLDDTERANIRALVVRRRKREPVAYITGQREFYRRSFAVTPAVLIPRPDTETLIERALELLTPDGHARVLDLCTGSGAIAVTLAAERVGLHVTATDVSAAALEVARSNAERHGVSERMQFLEGDLFAAVDPSARFALIAANPPYVAEPEMGALQPEIGHEPRLALASGSDGLDHLRRLSERVGEHLEPGGAVLFEVGQGQAASVRELLESHGLVEARSHKDLAGIERIVEARTRSST